MAKKQQATKADTPSKSQAIRQALSENPNASPKEVAEIVNAKHALGVTGQYVSVVKFETNKKSDKASRSAGGTGTTAAAKSTKSAADRLAAAPDAFEAAIGLIEAAGGLDEARATLERLERLRGKL